MGVHGDVCKDPESRLVRCKSFQISVASEKRQPGGSPAGWSIDGKESQVVLAEAKLTVYKLLNDAKRQAEEIIAQAKEQAESDPGTGGGGV